MCQAGVRAHQSELIIEHLSNQIALDRRLVHKLYHMADDANLSKSAQKFQSVQALLDEARASLEEARDLLLQEVEPTADVTVELV